MKISVQMSILKLLMIKWPSVLVERSCSIINVQINQETESIANAISTDKHLFAQTKKSNLASRVTYNWFTDQYDWVCQWWPMTKVHDRSEVSLTSNTWTPYSVMQSKTVPFKPLCGHFYLNTVFLIIVCNTISGVNWCSQCAGITGCKSHTL